MKTIVGQLSWPIPVDTWLNCRAQTGWTEALTSLRGMANVALFGTHDGSESHRDPDLKDGVWIHWRPKDDHARHMAALDPDVVFWNDFPPIFRNSLRLFPSKTRHVMRMHGDYRRFWNHFDVFQKAWCTVVPMIADPIIARAFGVHGRVERVPFGVDVPHMSGGKPWHERTVDVSCPASEEFKGIALWKVLKPVLEGIGLKCETAAWRSRDNLRDLLHNTKVFFVPSAHEGLSRVTTEAAVSGCRIVVSRQSSSMVEQAGLQGGVAVDTDLLSDTKNLQWTHRRDLNRIAYDLAEISTQEAPEDRDWSEWDISNEVALLRKVFMEALQ